MATVKYGTLDLIPAPLIGINIQSRFFGADIRFSRSQIYSLRGTLLNNQTSGISGIFLQQQDIVTGLASDYQPFLVNGQFIGFPKVNSISFDESNYLQKDGYTIELEFLESGNPFQITGLVYGFTGVTGLFYNIESLSEDLNYNTDFKTFNYSQSIDINYRTGVGIDPLLNAKIIASGLINSKAGIPFVVTSGSFGNTTYEERTDIFNGSYGVTQNFVGSTGTGAYNHNYSVSVRLEENGITNVSQNGTILGFDPNKYQNAKSGYADIRNTIYNTCSGAYVRYVGGLLNDTYLSDSRIDDVLAGSINYSRAYNDGTGIQSGTTWQYTHQMTLNGNKINLSEQGSVGGYGHISTRFNQASGVFDSVRPGIPSRTLTFYSGFKQTGQIYNLSKNHTYDRFNGTIGYDYEFSNDNNFGLGSGIRSLISTVSDNLPIHNRVAFSVVHQGVLLQNLDSTRQGERSVALEIQAFRDTTQTGILQFCTNTLNKYAPVNLAQTIDPFLNALSLNYNPLENNLSCNAQYVFGGYKNSESLNI